MHAVALRALRTVSRPISRQACRVIAGVRYPLSQRHFHRSAVLYRSSDDPAIAENDTKEAIGTDNSDRVTNGTGVEKSIEEDTVQGVENVSSTKVKGRGSARGRANRQKQPEGLPPVNLPDWFWDKNVKCFGDPDLGGTLAVYYDGDYASPSLQDPETVAQTTRAIKDIMDCELNGTEHAKYSVHVDVYKEIISSIRAGLTLRPSQGFSEKKNISRPVLLLQCPKDGGAFYLDSIVETIATKLEADLVRLDPQDIAQILGPYLDENPAWTFSPTSLLGYDTSKVAGRLEEYDKEDFGPAEDSESIEDDEGNTNLSKIGKSGPAVTFIGADNMADVRKKLSTYLSRGDFSFHKAPDPGKRPGFGDFLNPSDAGASKQPLKPGTDQWNELKTVTLLESLILSPDSKRASGTQGSEDDTKPRDLIIQVRDYKEMIRTVTGVEIIDKLRTIISRRWQLGRNIIMVGTSSSEEAEPALSRSEIQHLQSDIIEGEKRTIFVPPDRREQQDVTFESDEKSRTREINIRHIEDMLTQLSGDANITVKIEKDLDNASVYSSGLEEAVWTYSRVHRLAIVILGLEKSLTVVDGPMFTRAELLLAESDRVKFAWGAAELKQEDTDVNNMIDEITQTNTSRKITKDKLKQIRKTCTPHEKKLLTGVVIPSDIHTTFSDVHVPKATIEALKTLTSLSLIRPEAFTYGVLATDKIPGLLLYGPPGTGKTLLAKAVAKESGVTVLEVSGAEVNDMYVGEGEKNVRAIFSLAKKLSPCIVFIDEADAIFAARGDAKKSVTHRELINQFLREWDGMNDLSAFIMVATNRPFDLDEAVLRRLPRRLLVDLPVEKDREAILNIHLKDEFLDPSVSLSDLAKNTPFYSGSDLKNLCVAAALACIREENETAAKHEGEDPYVFPEKRTLTKGHFDKAMEEISASINEDMSTLSAIRKFDEKYGDRKGRRKKSDRLGFGGTTDSEKDSEAGRVRKAEVLGIKREMEGKW